MTESTGPLSPLSLEDSTSGGDVFVLSGEDVLDLLRGREQEILDAVRVAYELHSRGETVLPSSSFLRFPGKKRERIIALPAYLGGSVETAGIKWIASFPENVRRGMDRASAVIVLNSMETGRPTALMEGSVISAKRTAASGALAARHLHQGPPPRALGLIGCGLINFEVARFVLAVHPEVEEFVLFDLDAERAERFGDRLRRLRPGAGVRVAQRSADAFGAAPLVSLATTAVEPHLDDLSSAQDGATILHLSLRDFTPEVILASDNLADDVEHVCQAQTSVHLAAQRTGDTAFVRGTLADVLLERIPARSPDHRVTIFNPFGMGVLDMALARLAMDLAPEQGRGTRIPSFVPQAWGERV